MLIEKLRGVADDIVGAMNSRIETLAYNFQVNGGLAAVKDYFVYIVGNIENTVKKPIAQGGLGYSESEWNGLKSVLVEGLAYASTLMQQTNSTITDANKSVLKNNLDLVYLPQLNFSAITNAEGLFQGDYNLMTLPEVVLPSSITSIKNIFNGCRMLRNSEKFLVEGSGLLNMDGAMLNAKFESDPVRFLCGGKTVEYNGKTYYDYSRATSMSQTFATMYYTGKTIGNIYAPNCTNCSSMLASSSAYEYMEELGDVYIPLCTNANRMLAFQGWIKVGKITVAINCDLTFVINVSTLEDFAGISGATKSLDLSNSLSLTPQSVKNVLQTLVDDLTERQGASTAVQANSPVLTFKQAVWNAWLASDIYDANLKSDLESAGWTINTVA